MYQLQPQLDLHLYISWGLILTDRRSAVDTQISILINALSGMNFIQYTSVFLKNCHSLSVNFSNGIKDSLTFDLLTSVMAIAPKRFCGQDSRREWSRGQGVVEEQEDGSWLAMIEVELNLLATSFLEQFYLKRRSINLIKKMTDEENYKPVIKVCFKCHHKKVNVLRKQRLKKEKSWQIENLFKWKLVFNHLISLSIFLGEVWNCFEKCFC